MRIKFQKGLSPEVMASMFLEIIRDRGMLVGAVNIYVQEYDENMKPIFGDGDCLEVTPTDAGKKIYSEYAAGQRRSKLKAI